MSAIYTADFTSIKNVNYKIEINTEKGGGTHTLMLSGEPFSTKMDSEGKNIYSPLKTTSATIGIMTKSLESNIYSGKAKGTTVKFTNTDTGKVEFIGYATPCKYDQDWNEELEEVEIECVDGIAVLKSLPYPVTGSLETFANIIFSCLKQSECFKQLYVTDNVQLTVNGTDNIIEKLRVSQNNFFDEKQEGQTNDDVAMSCYDVLIEVMQFLGYTMFAEGDEVYIIDYDAIKRGNNKYFSYSLEGATLGTYTTTTRQYDYQITGESIGATGTTLSLDKVYNKVTVKDDFYTYDSLFPNFGDAKFETNITAALDWNSSDLITKRGYYVIDTITQTSRTGKSENFTIFICPAWKNKTLACIVKFYKSDVFQFCKYDKDTKQDRTEEYEKDMTWSKLFEVHGATYVRMWKKEVSKGDAEAFKGSYNYTFPQEEKLKKWIDFLNRDPQDIALTPYVLCLNWSDGHIGPAALQSTGKYDRTDNEDCRKYPFVKLRRFDSSVFGGTDAYLLVNGKQLSHDEQNTPFPISDGGNNKDLKRAPDYKFDSEGFLWCRMKWGQNYWNGDGWQQQPCDFKLQYWSGDGKIRVKNYYDKFFDFADTASKAMVKGAKGYYMTCPQVGNLAGEAEFIIYCNRDLWGRSNHNHWDSANRYSRYYNYVQVLSNLTMTAEISNGMLDDMENDTDTSYTNVIATGAVDKMSDIKFKICTYDNKKPSYSGVDYLDSDNKSVYLKYTYNKALNSLETSVTASNRDGSKMVQEEHLIFKLVNQYQEPRTIIKTTLKNIGHKLYGTYTDKIIKNKTFIVSEMNIDYKQETAEMKLTEKF